MSLLPLTLVLLSIATGMVCCKAPVDLTQRADPTFKLPKTLSVLAIVHPGQGRPSPLVSSHGSAPSPSSQRTSVVNGFNRLLLVVMTCISRNLKDNLILYSTGIETVPQVKILFVLPTFLFLAHRLSRPWRKRGAE